MVREVRTKRLKVNVTESLRTRFWQRVERRGVDDCWPWKACLRNGYGAIKHEGKVLSAHVVAYCLTAKRNPPNECPNAVLTPILSGDPRPGIQGRIKPGSHCSRTRAEY